MKNLYIVEYWVPFPQSEYGGIVNVIAETDSEVFDLLSTDDSFHESYKSYHAEYQKGTKIPTRR